MYMLSLSFRLISQFPPRRRQENIFCVLSSSPGGQIPNSIWLVPTLTLGALEEVRGH
jgi:hypothetical protein